MSREYVTFAEIAEREKLENLTPDIDLNTVKIYHRSLNRPQLFLAGYREYFDTERVQHFGRAESEYMKTFSRELIAQRAEELFSSGIPGIIMCKGIPVPDDFLKCAEKYRVPILYTKADTALIIVNVVGWINEQLAPTVTLYGVLVDVYGEGILITGDSGIGKSETALELIKRGHRLVADDMVEISRVGDSILFGQAPELTQHFIELRGIGVVDVKSLYGIESVKDRCPVDMIISLEEWIKGKNYDRLGLNEEFENILGVNIIKHTVPIRTGRNLAIIIETAAVNNRQKKMGYNAARELCDRVSATIKNKKKESDSI